MRILMVSMVSPHFFNWVEQLKNAGHEIYWIDIFDTRDKAEKIEFVKKIEGWRFRWNYPGRYYLKKNLPKIYQWIRIINERDFGNIFQEILREIKPDVVHSFVMHLTCFPIFPVMKNNPNMKWIYSSWGSDLFASKFLDSNPELLERVLERIDYLFTDCERDFIKAKSLGFKGKFLGVFPGGGGIDIEKWNEFMLPWHNRNYIIIKGYQNAYGKSIQVLKAIYGLRRLLKEYEIIVFGADEEVFKFVEKTGFQKWNNFTCLGKIPHQQVMELMGRSMLYIGNSTSDGIPNSLLEAICMGVFPVQSNPGGASAELITDSINGYLIKDALDEEVISDILQKVLKKKNLRDGVLWNLQNIKPTLERVKVKKEVLECYNVVQASLISPKKIL